MELNMTRIANRNFWTKN